MSSHLIFPRERAEELSNKYSSQISISGSLEKSSLIAYTVQAKVTTMLIAQNTLKHQKRTALSSKGEGLCGNARKSIIKKTPKSTVANSVITAFLNVCFFVLLDDHTNSPLIITFCVYYNTNRSTCQDKHNFSQKESSFCSNIVRQRSLLPLLLTHTNK